MRRLNSFKTKTSLFSPNCSI